MNKSSSKYFKKNRVCAVCGEEMVFINNIWKHSGTMRIFSHNPFLHVAETAPLRYFVSEI